MVKELDLRPRYLHSLIERLVDALPGAAEETYERFVEHYGEYPAIEERIVPLVKKQCAAIRKTLDPIGSFRGRGKGGSTARLQEERKAESEPEQLERIQQRFADIPADESLVDELIAERREEARREAEE